MAYYTDEVKTKQITLVTLKSIFYI